MLILDEKKIVRDFGNKSELCRSNGFNVGDMYTATRDGLGRYKHPNSKSYKLRKYLLANGYAKEVDTDGYTK